MVVADDLMWSTRIAEAVRRTGATAVRLSSIGELAVALDAEAIADEPTVVGAVVDLNGRRYDGVDAIERVSAARLPVVAIAEHDDELTRKRALTAGASRVFSYRKFHTDGTALVERWFAAATADPGGQPS